jgi:D-lactate dehydrogenase
MALIYFYDATELDKQQLSAELQHTDHHWEFVEDHISLDNIHPDIEVLSVFVSSSVTAEMIEKLPKLRLIACRSTGFNNVDLQAAATRNITVVNVPSYGEKTVAEYTFALILALTRKLREASTNLDTTAQPQLMGIDLAGKTIGVIGVGRIGSNTIRIAKGFSMGVLAYDPYPKQELADELGFTFADLDTVLRQSDVVSLHVPFTGTNKHLIDAEALAKMKPTAILINTSRGELVDTAALIQALQSHKLAAAGLDVIEDEHLLSLHGEIELLQTKHTTNEAYLHSLELLALQKMPQVLLTPHNAFNTEEALGRINQTTADNIVKFWYGNVPNKVVAKQTMGKLFVVRHAESEWNALGKWTGTTDVHLSDKGFREAAMLGQIMPQVPLEKAYASQQIRTLETLSGILDSSQHFDVPIERIAAINERDYGDYTGLNKWEVKEKLGEDVFNKIRREWDYPVPNGETLKDVYERAYPFYRDVIVPQLKAGKNILIAAHGNSIRALMHYFESIPEEKMVDVEMLFGTIIEYDVDETGKMVAKKEYKIDSTPPAA